MTKSQALISFLIAFHLVGITVGAVPGLEDFGADTTAIRPPGLSLRSRLTSRLDQVSVAAIRGHRVAYALSAPLHRPVRFYLDITDQYAQWNMFSNPARFSYYVRLDYAFMAPDGTTTHESELVYPATEPGRWRIVAAYFDSFVDKAFANGIEAYQTRAFKAAREARAEPVAAMREDLLPFVRYYGRQRLASQTDGARLTRVEFWHGAAPSPPPGAELSAETLLARQSPNPPKGNDIHWQRWLVDDGEGK